MRSRPQIGKLAVPCDMLEAAAAFKNHSTRVVKRDEVGPLHVSTVFCPMTDRSCCPGPRSHRMVSGDMIDNLTHDVAADGDAAAGRRGEPDNYAITDGKINSALSTAQEDSLSFGYNANTKV